MMSGDWTDGEPLIFVICQPRSGSTMLQRMLSAHPHVATTSEPWLLLPALYVLRDGEVTAGFDAPLARLALRSFLAELPEGEEELWDAMRATYGSLYRSASQQLGGSRFLDKTPRYYFIIPEIRRLFPEARVVLLVRHPLAVLASILETWIGGAWTRLIEYRHDLLTAPREIFEATRRRDRDRISVVRYERLVEHPSREVASLCAELGLPPDPAVTRFGSQRNSPWAMGDQDRAFNTPAPDPARAMAWPRSFTHPQAWRCARDYLELLGADVMDGLGYDFDAAEELLRAHEPGGRSLRSTVPLSWLIGIEGPRTRRDKWRLRRFLASSD